MNLIIDDLVYRFSLPIFHLFFLLRLHSKWNMCLVLSKGLNKNHGSKDRQQYRADLERK